MCWVDRVPPRALPFFFVGDVTRHVGVSASTAEEAAASGTTGVNTGACVWMLLIGDKAAVVSGSMAWSAADVGVAALATSSPLPNNRKGLCSALLVILVGAAAAARACEKSSLMPVRRGNLYGE